MVRKFTKYPSTSVKASTQEHSFEVDIYDEDGDWERTKSFTDLKAARKWVDQFNYDAVGQECAVPINFQEH